MASGNGLSTRQFERGSVNLPARFVIDPDHHSQIRFGATALSATQDTVQGRIVDFSSGGVGLMLPHYLPRLCRGTLRVYEPGCESSDGDAVGEGRPIFEHRVQVRRVRLAGHDPSYSIGVAFVEPDSALEGRVEAVLRGYDGGSRHQSGDGGGGEGARDA